MQVVKDEELMIDTKGGVTSPKGFQAGGMFCGIRKKKLDLGYIYSSVPATAAGVYTLNQFRAAPLLVTKESIEQDKKLQAILVNSGIANACTGEAGLQDAYEMRNVFAEALKLSPHYVGVASTGVIGVALPMDRIVEGANDIVKPDHLGVEKFQEAILTTDTCVKHISVECEIDGNKVVIGGAAKGSGMIHPNMATMLGFVTTDAKIDYKNLDFALRNVTNNTFNMITVDGDTSTNDMVLVLANGEAENNPLTVNHPQWHVFQQALNKVCSELAKKIARDGEGATKLIEVIVKNAPTKQSAQIIGKSIISSNLVKAAMYGADANWGRIVSAIGNSGVKINPSSLKVSLGPIEVVSKGLPIPFSEEEAKLYLLQEDISIIVNLGIGEEKATAWGCDLTYDYVKINASYRT